jgi:hypothetical protein
LAIPDSGAKPMFDRAYARLQQARQEDVVPSSWVILTCLALGGVAIIAVVLEMLFPYSLYWAALALLALGVSAVILGREIGFFFTRSQSPLLRFAFFSKGMSSIFLIFHLDSPTTIVFQLTSIIIWMLICVLLLSVYQIFVRKRLERGEERGGIDSAISVFFMALPVLAGVLALTSITPVADFLENRPGQPASWSEQLRIAQREAHKIAPEAVLMSVEASPSTYRNPNFETPLSVTFLFENEEGLTGSVEFEEIAPELTDDVYDIRGASVGGARGRARAWHRSTPSEHRVVASGTRTSPRCRNT